MSKAIDTYQANDLWALMRGTRAPITIQRAIEESYAAIDNSQTDVIRNDAIPIDAETALRPIIDALIAEGVLK